METQQRAPIVLLSYISRAQHCTTLTRCQRKARRASLTDVGLQNISYSYQQYKRTLSREVSDMSVRF